MKTKKTAPCIFDLKNKVKNPEPLAKDQSPPDLKKLRSQVAQMQDKTYTLGKGRKLYG